MKAISAIMAELLNSIEESSEFPRLGNVSCSLIFPSIVPDPKLDVNTYLQTVPTRKYNSAVNDSVRWRGLRKGRKVKGKKSFYKNHNREDIYCLCGGLDFTLTRGRLLSIY